MQIPLTPSMPDGRTGLDVMLDELVISAEQQHEHAAGVIPATFNGTERDRDIDAFFVIGTESVNGIAVHVTAAADALAALAATVAALTGDAPSAAWRAPNLPRLATLSPAAATALREVVRRLIAADHYCAAQIAQDMESQLRKLVL